MSTPLVAAVLPVWERLLATSQAQSETAVSEMLSAFSEMTPHLNTEDSDLGLLIERMYVGFQYQDRISQMLAVLRSDMQRLESALKESAAQGNVLDAETWLKRLESQYVMTEQHRDHQGGNGEATPLVETQNETTFF